MMAITDKSANQSEKKSANNSAIQRSFFTRIIEAMAAIKSHELRATCVSFLMVFILMASYFVLRPVRDAMASDWSDTEVSMLWNLQFFISAIIIAVYGWVISRIAFRLIVPLVYAAFGLSFIAFYLLMPWLTNHAVMGAVWGEKAFYLWVSAFSLFHLSVFWSLMATTFTQEQSKRLFAVIASGSSAGAIVGPAIPAFFASHLGLDILMLIAATGLALVVPLVLYLYRVQRLDLCSEHGAIHGSMDRLGASMGGHWWSGFKSVITNRYLMGISAFILLYVFIGSFVYFEQKNLLASYSRPERAQILGTIDVTVNTLTFVMALFVTSRLVTRLGMTVTLMLLPLLLMIGMLALAIAPLVVIVMAVQVARRTGNYAVARPAREMLFTQVSDEDRFKSKPVIDVVVYRGGDAASGMVFAFLSDGIGLGLAAIAFVGAAVSTIWAIVARQIGRVYECNDQLTEQPNTGQSGVQTDAQSVVKSSVQATV